MNCVGIAVCQSGIHAQLVLNSPKKKRILYNIQISVLFYCMIIVDHRCFRPWANIKTQDCIIL